MNTEDTDNEFEKPTYNTVIDPIIINECAAYILLQSLQNMKKLRTIFDKGICCNLTRIFVVCVVFSLLFSQLSGIGLGIIIKVKGRLRSTAMFGKGCHCHAKFGPPPNTVRPD